jgi:hypothetical protein
MAEKRHAHWVLVGMHLDHVGVDVRIILKGS